MAAVCLCVGCGVPVCGLGCLCVGRAVPVCSCVCCVVIQLVSHCVDVLVTAFKDTIIAECPQMIKNNETESESYL